MRNLIYVEKFAMDHAAARHAYGQLAFDHSMQYAICTVQQKCYNSN